MWSRKPTPVLALASPPSRSSESRTLVSAVLRSLAAVLLISFAFLDSDHRRLAVDGQALRTGERVHVRCKLRRRLGRNLHRGDAAAEGARPERPGEAAGAAGRQDVVGAGDVV